MNEPEKVTAFKAGRESAYRAILAECLRNLPGVDTQSTLAAERATAISVLRVACDEHGDNDWPNDMRLGDIIEKHLLRHLGANQ